MTNEGFIIDPEPPVVMNDSDSDDGSHVIESPSKHSALKLNRIVPEGAVTLEECLQMFTSEETLDEENSWYCSSCKTHRQALKTIQFWSPPKILIIGLKRFETHTSGGLSQMYASQYGMPQALSGGMHREKISTFVDFPIRGLDLSPFCKNKRQSVATSKKEESKRGRGKGARGCSGFVEEGNEFDPDDPYIYDLYAVINHYGRMGFGHYTAMARDWEGLPPSDKDGTEESSNLWCSYDDDIIHVIDEKSVKTSAAYILFYRQRICK